ncbi:hypothetical protein Tco_0579623, partial [Tanacetum coccineum]
MMRPHPSRMQVLYGHIVCCLSRKERVKLNIFFSEQIKHQLITLLNSGPEGESETIDLEICKFTVKKIEAQVSKCVAHTGLCQPAVTPTVVLERKGLQRKEGSDYMELKGEHDLDLKTHSTKIHILNAYATLKTRTFYIVEASDRRLRWKNTLANVNDKAKKVTENTDNTPFEDSLDDVAKIIGCSIDELDTIESQDESSCLLGAAYVCDIRTSYVSRQCTSSDGDNAAPCLPRGLAVLDWLDAELKTLIATYDIPLDLRPRLPDSNFRMSILPAGDTAIGGGLVRSGLSRVWRNPMCDPVLRRSDNTAMSIHDFLCMPSLEKATVREEPHELGTSILSRVADHTTPPAPAGTAIPRASPEEIAVTRPDRNVVAKADHAAKRKTSTGPEISTNTTKRTRLSQKVSRAGSSGLAAGDEVEQTDDGTLDDDDQRDGLEFAVEDVGNLNDVGQGEHINVIPLRTFDPSLGLDVTYPPILLPDKEVEAHAELFGDARRTTRASSHASHGVDGDAFSPAQEAVPAPGVQPLDTDAGADEIASDGNVDSYFDARVSNTAGDVLERDLLSF